MRNFELNFDEVKTMQTVEGITEYLMNGTVNSISDH